MRRLILILPLLLLVVLPSCQWLPPWLRSLWPSPTASISPSIPPTISSPLATGSVPPPGPVEPAEIDIGPAGTMRMALTFDAGADPGYTKEILDICRKHKAPATFFLTGDWLEQNVEDAREMVLKGHALGNHCQTHLHLTPLEDEEVRSELQQMEDTCLRLVGHSTKPYFRAPFGERDGRILRLAAQEGYWHIYWTLDSLDWEMGHSTDWVKERVLNRLQDGAILLFHVSSPYTFQILDDLLDQMEFKGYRIVPLADFLPLPTTS